MSNSEIVGLNVGGTKYLTTKSTLRKYPRSFLGAMFTGDILLSKDENGYYFIDRCGHIFHYILQFLRCGKLVLPENFNESELLQLEADFYQIEDLISAIKHRKIEVAIKDGREVHTLLVFTLHRKNGYTTDIKLFKKSKDTGFKLLDENLQCYIPEQSKVRDLLQSFGWILKEEKVGLQQSEACIFFLMHGMEKDMFFKGSLRENYSSMDVETWLGSIDIKF